MKLFLTLFFALTISYVNLYAEGIGEQKVVADSVLYSTTFYFKKNQSEWIDKSEYLNVGRLLRWAEANSSAIIDIKGWSGQSGTEDVSARLSFKRAKTIRNYLVKKGIDSSRIVFEDKGVDFKADSKKARRADVVAYIFVAEEEEEVHEIAEGEKIADQVRNDEVVIHNNDGQVDNDDAKVRNEEVEVSNDDVVDKRELSYYAGAGVGFIPIWSTFAGAGLNFQAYSGVEFTEFISAEISLGYSNINMKATHCCKELYYVEGERFFAPVAGIVSYRYGNLTSKVNMLHLGAKVNFNILTLFVKESVWSGLVSPKISYVQSWENIQNDKISIDKESSPHFGVGVDLSGGYMINSNWGVRLTTGIEYLTGKGVDGMPQCEHNSNTLWNTNASVIYKF